MSKLSAGRTEIWWVVSSLLFLLVAGCDGQPSTSTPAPPGPMETSEVPVFGVADVVLRSDELFDARSGDTNPFDATLTAVVQSPSGVEREVFGFFDGDGQGGAEGNIFRLRIQPDEPGIWNWTTASDLPALDGREGSFEAQGTLAGAFGKGGVVVASEAPRFFAFREGAPVFLIGKFLDVDAPEPIQYSHTFFSEELSDADRRQMLDRHLAMGLNKMNVYIANRGDYGGTHPTTPWVGSAGSNDKERFALDRWHQFDEWVAELRDAGMVAQLWFFADDSGFGGLSREEKERLVAYGMARLSAYANTMFVLMLEWQEGWTREGVDALGTFTQAHNPWQRLVSAHGTTGEFSFPDAEWVDFMELQAGNTAGRDIVYARGLATRDLAEKPFVQEEFGLGEETTENRVKSWAAFLSGPAGSGTGAFLSPLSDFIAAIPFAGLQPSPSLLLSGTAFISSYADSLYVAYLPEGGRIEIDLSASAGEYIEIWYDPRNGTRRVEGILQGGQTAVIDALDARDWALILERR